jgi:rhamnosyltransferase
MIICVTVTYNPDFDILIQSLSSISNQVDRVYVIDNGSLSPFHDRLSFDNVSFYSLGDNFGIGYAQNYGMNLALDLEPDFIMLSDQDTIYPKHYCSTMSDSLLSHSEACVVAPLFEDARSKKVTEFFPENTYFLTKFRPKSGYYYISQAIASGMFIRVSSLKEIGIMNEDLFIDWVDFEWCWRATFYGYRILLNSDVKVLHYLGDSTLDSPFGSLEMRSPLRHYYITRNAFFLSLYCNYLPYPKRFTLFVRSLRYLVGFPVLCNPHVENLKLVCLAFFHGLRKVQGKLKRFDS